MLLEDVVLRPTGAGEADASGRREQKEDARMTPVTYELRPQLLDTAEVDESDVGSARPRLGPAAAAARRDERERRESRHAE
jgi:hypothetical protein